MQKRKSDEIIRKLSTLLNEEIIHKNCSIKAFAELSGVSYNCMRAIINGKSCDIKFSTLIKICEYTDISLYNLFVDDKDITEDLLNKLFITHKGRMYSISAKAYK